MIGQGRRLATMGRPTSRGHVLSLEEAVFLMELNVAAVMVDSMPMSIERGYRLLEHSRISWARYLAFGHLKRLGFIVIPTSLPMETTHSSSSSSSSPPSKRVRLRESAPSSLLQHIPHLDGNGHLSMVSLHRNRQLVPCEVKEERDDTLSIYLSYFRSVQIFITHRKQ